MSNISTDVAQAALSKTTARQYSHRPGTGVVVVAIILSLLSLLPLGFVIGIAIDTGWSTVKALVFSPSRGRITDQYRFTGGFHLTPLRHDWRCISLADRTHCPARQATLVTSGNSTTGSTCFCTKLCLDQSDPLNEWAGRRRLSR